MLHRVLHYKDSQPTSGFTLHTNSRSPPCTDFAVLLTSSSEAVMFTTAATGHHLRNVHVALKKAARIFSLYGWFPHIRFLCWTESASSWLQVYIYPTDMKVAIFQQHRPANSLPTSEVSMRGGQFGSPRNTKVHRNMKVQHQQQENMRETTD